MDPDGQEFRRQYLGGRGLLVDSNVLIDLLPPSGRGSERVAGTLKLARLAGIPLFTSSAILREVHQHGVWASELVRRYTEDSVQVLQAALGQGYGENEFLEGFINHSIDEKRLSFTAYLRAAVGGGEFDPSGIADFLKKAHGISLLDVPPILVKHTSLYE